MKVKKADCEFTGKNVKMFLDEIMTKSGYARPITDSSDERYSQRYADLFQKLYKEARENKRGLWK